MSILFDLDGTLLDTAPDFAYIINQLRQEEALSPIAPERIRYCVSGGLADIISAGFGISASDPNHSHLSKRFLTSYGEMLGSFTTPFPGIIDLLQALDDKKIRWGIVTNKRSIHTLPLLTKLGLANRAACIVSGDTTPNPKPHPDPVLYACKQLDIQPHEAIFIGDAEADIIAGKKAGMTTLGALFGYIKDIDAAHLWGADAVVYHPNEILPWYEAWQHEP